MCRFPALPPGVSLRQPSTLIATCFAVGLLPRAPGTFGSLVALPLAWYLQSWYGPAAIAAAGAALFVVGWWASAEVVKRSDSADPSYIVVDEVAGQAIALTLVPADPLYYAAAFLGFRLFDIVKPWPVGWADRTVKGGLGVMLDDALAALYVVAILFAARQFIAI